MATARHRYGQQVHLNGPGGPVGFMYYNLWIDITIIHVFFKLYQHLEYKAVAPRGPITVRSGREIICVRAKLNDALIFASLPLQSAANSRFADLTLPNDHGPV